MTRKEAIEVIQKTHRYLELTKCQNQVAEEICGRKMPPIFPVTEKLLQAAKALQAELVKLEGEQ